MVMSKQKKSLPKYSTLQVRKIIHEQIVDYCDKNGLKIGRFVELLFLEAVSGSIEIGKQTDEDKHA
jgi:hypothetical protein